MPTRLSRFAFPPLFALAASGSPAAAQDDAAPAAADGADPAAGGDEQSWGDAANAAGGELVERAVSLLEALPGSAHLVMVIALIGGIALWLYGARLIKPATAALGIAAGGVLGLMMPPLLGIDAVGGVSSWLIGLGVGMVIGFVVALVLLKIAVTLAAGVAFAVAGLLGGLIYVQHAGPPPIEPDADGVAITDPAIDTPSWPRDADGNRLYRDPRTGNLVTLRELLLPLETAEGEPAADPDEDRLMMVATHIRAVVAEAADAVRMEWQSVPPQNRVILVGSTLGAFSAGLLAGLLLPRRSAAFVTALMGSAVWLAAGVWLIQGVGFLEGARGITELSPRGWAIVWALATVIGLAIQIGGLAKAKKPKAEDD